MVQLEARKTFDHDQNNEGHSAGDDVAAALHGVDQWLRCFAHLQVDKCWIIFLLWILMRSFNSPGLPRQHRSTLLDPRRRKQWHQG